MTDYSPLFEMDPDYQKVAPRRSRKPVLLASLLLPVLVVTGLLAFWLLQPRLGPLVQSLLAMVNRSPAAQPAAAPPTATVQAAALPSATALPVLTATRNPPSPTPTALPSACPDWSEVTLDDVGKELCVQGEYSQTSLRTDGTYVMVFSQDPGVFQVWSFPKSFEYYLKGSESTCVVVRGRVNTSGVRPIIILGAHGVMEACKP
jgi:hypothetical protein